MAIARLNKIRILTHASGLEDLLDDLQEGGSVEMIDLRSRRMEELYSGLAPKDGSSDAGVEKIRQSKEDLAYFIELVSSLNKSRHYSVTKSEFKRVISGFDHHDIVERAKKIDARIGELEAERAALEAKLGSITPWRSLDVDLEDICRVSYTIRGLGTISLEDLELMRRRSAESGKDLFIHEVGRTKERANIFFIYLRADDDAIKKLFKECALESIFFPECRHTPGQLYDMTVSSVEKIMKAEREARKELEELAARKKEAMIYYDHIVSLDAKARAEGRTLKTREVYIVEGWVKASLSADLKAKIEKKFIEVDVSVEEPQEGDEIPVLLENPVFLKPFELITKIYGMPAYKEIDPTPFLAPFFFFFFGFCITDAAYGLILAMLAAAAIVKFKPKGDALNFVKLLLYGGVSTVLLGALTGGWFGNAIDMLADSSSAFLPLKRAKDSITMLDPMKEPMKLLVIALSIGVVQIWSGHVIAMIGNIKNRRYLDAILDQGSTFVFLFGFTGIILGVLSAAPASMRGVFMTATAAGSVAIILTGGRTNPTIGSKLFYGAFTLYNSFSGYISDVLSYSRLWALGLVTGVMAATSNLMAVIMGGMVPRVGFIITLAILLGGHFITLVMNLLGAFIHPIRLQFVEFFSKFFKGGGRPFSPLSIENRFTRII